MKKSVVVKMQQDFEARPIANLVQVGEKNNFRGTVMDAVITCVEKSRKM